MRTGFSRRLLEFHDEPSADWNSAPQKTLVPRGTMAPAADACDRRGLPGLEAVGAWKPLVGHRFQRGTRLPAPPRHPLRPDRPDRAGSAAGQRDPSAGRPDAIGVPAV